MNTSEQSNSTVTETFSIFLITLTGFARGESLTTRQRKIKHRKREQTLAKQKEHRHNRVATIEQSNSTVTEMFTVFLLTLNGFARGQSLTTRQRKIKYRKREQTFAKQQEHRHNRVAAIEKVWEANRTKMANHQLTRRSSWLL